VARSVNLVVGGDMERDTDAWDTDAKFGDNHKVSYEIIRGSKHTMELSGSAFQTVDLRSIAKDARHFGFGAYLTSGVRAKIRFFGADDHELASYDLKPTERFTRVAASHELPSNATKATIEFTYVSTSERQTSGFIDDVVLFVDSKPVMLLAEPNLTAKRTDEPTDQPIVFTYDVRAEASIVGPDSGFPIGMQNLRNIKLEEIDRVPVPNGGENYVVPNLRRASAGVAWTSTFRNPRGIMEVKFWVDENRNGIADPSEDAVVTWIG
jgi:hypothetical protein